ncbi:IucA/IucC family protein [Motiliproteus sp. MSK22-1]|uniref:IucA/IucC family protein n=1 Tax=Motiliproteus sp. MSK22-1 TaxID=1897630 RepID=UPI000977A10E|nr:IucA/IucC family protein [Motiliproteus sp. MSK22-1]OMH33817.1 hypothetical protein BGP75_12575 [Motiliproteus sp. MSK22-1]
MTLSVQKRLKRAEHILLSDLFDALWMENLFGFRTHSQIAQSEPDQSNQQLLVTPVTAEHRICWPIRLDPKSSKPQISAEIYCDNGQDNPLTLVAVCQSIVNATWWPQQANGERFIQWITQARDYQLLLLDKEAEFFAPLLQPGKLNLAEWECIASLRDRPFHPVAKAKVFEGISIDSHQLLPGKKLQASWWAIPRTLSLQSVEENSQPGLEQPFFQLLTDNQQQVVKQVCEKQQLDLEEYLILPVHPLQALWIKTHNCFLAARDLGVSATDLIATSSLRSLVVKHQPHLHLKLSLSITSLGAVRVQPARYLHNGQLAQRVFSKIQDRDEWLANHVELCEETLWASMSEHQENPLLQENGELSCLLRSYPESLINDPDIELVPMSALAVQNEKGQATGVRRLLSIADQTASLTSCLKLFEVIAKLLSELGLRCFNYGVMPELHGQNVLLICRLGEIQGLLLRDHDTLRTCPLMMEAQDLQPPCYVMDRSTPGTLELENPEELLAYFQTLVLEVNLYAIMDAMCRDLNSAEQPFWHLLQSVLNNSVQGMSNDSARDIAARELFSAQQWPFKQLLHPLLMRQSLGSGMPCGMLPSNNPLAELTGA